MPCAAVVRAITGACVSRKLGLFSVLIQMVHYICGGLGWVATGVCGCVPSTSCCGAARCNVVSALHQGKPYKSVGKCNAVLTGLVTDMAPLKTAGQSAAQPVPRVARVIKIGGAAITDKQVQSSLQPQVLAATAAQLAAAADQHQGAGLVVVHGAGSFGHHQAAAAGVHRGGIQGSPAVRQGFAATRSVVALCRRVLWCGVGSFPWFFLCCSCGRDAGGRGRMLPHI